MSTQSLTLTRYAQQRANLLERVTDVLRASPQVAAVWLSGSFGRGEADAWSDFDLHVAVYDADFPTFLLERPALYTRIGSPLLVQEDMASNSMPAGRYQLVLYPGPIEVDWNVGPVSQAVLPVAYQMLFSRADIPSIALPALNASERQSYAENRLVFFWAMAPIAVKYAGRGETRRAVHQIDLLSEALIALWRLLAQPDGPNPHLPATNRVLEPAFDDRLPQFGPTIDPQVALRVIAALCDEAEQLYPALIALGVTIPTAVSGEVANLRALAETVISQGTQPRRKYR